MHMLKDCKQLRQVLYHDDVNGYDHLGEDDDNIDELMFVKRHTGDVWSAA
jgi:hypothetical protein